MIRLCFFSVEDLKREGFDRRVTESERNDLMRFRDESQRENHCAVRGFLRTVLGQILKQDPRTVVIARDGYGKQQTSGSPVHFNVSHAEDKGLLALAFHPVGVDLEKRRSWPAGMLHDAAEAVFNEKEKTVWASLPEAIRHDYFYRVWVRKEAAAKAIGAGVSLPFDSMETAEAGELRWSVPGLGLHGHDLRLDRGWFGAVCARGPWEKLDWFGVEEFSKTPLPNAS